MDDLLANRQRDLAGWLPGGDAEPLAPDLSALGRSEAAQGFFGIAGQHRRCANDPAYAELLAAWTHDKLVSLAEAVGAVRLELPENGPWGDTLRLSPADLFARIETKLGCDLTPPTHVSAYLGIDAGGRVLQMRVLEALYAAWRLKQIADAQGFTRICEIGAGAGLTAYYAALLGLTDYVIIDLPTMNAVQAYMLAGTRLSDGRAATRHSAAAQHQSGSASSYGLRASAECARSGRHGRRLSPAAAAPALAAPGLFEELYAWTREWWQDHSTSTSDDPA